MQTKPLASLNLKLLRGEGDTVSIIDHQHIFRDLNLCAVLFAHICVVEHNLFKRFLLVAYCSKLLFEITILVWTDIFLYVLIFCPTGLRKSQISGFYEFLTNLFLYWCLSSLLPWICHNGTFFQVFESLIHFSARF